MKNLIFILFFSLVLFSCQPIEKNDQIVFDNNQFTYFKILSTTIEIEDLFDKKISDPYIGHTLKTSPSQRVINWVNDNFTAIGNEFVVIADDKKVNCKIVEKPFYDPKKKNSFFLIFNFSLKIWT